MKSKIVLAIAIAFLANIASMTAQTATPGIRKTAKEERTRIKQGVESGELTKREAQKLAAEQAAIHQEVKAAKADGVVTREERKDIKQDQRQASRRIYRNKHDNQARH
jgi:uncharacterized membrane protein YebE (DUF533 family)